MKRIGMVIGIGAALVVAVGAWIFFSGGSGEPSTEVTAPPITAAQETTTTVTAAPEETEPPSTVAPTTTAADATGSVVTFEIDQSASTASFTLNEELRGAPTTVVGVTSELAGQIQVDFGNPVDSQVGQIVINARTLETDSSFRDRAIRGQILESASDEFEFITFTPTSIDGLPDEATAPFTFTVTGDLTVRTVTQPVTFTVEISDASETSVAGTATADVLRSDFDLNIPSVPSVANVTDEVQLDLVFVATPVG